MAHYILNDDGNKFTYSEAIKIDELNLNDIRRNILIHLHSKPMYPSQLAKKLKINEQKLYYHINYLLKAGILTLVEKKEIRGTTAKKFRPKAMNFFISLSKHWPTFTLAKGQSQSTKFSKFFEGFSYDNCFDGIIVVGSPDPHGPYKSRARDGHYAIDLSLFIGKYITIGKEFSTALDVDVDIKTSDKNLILVGGPVANQLVSQINDQLPAKFSDKKPWGIISKHTNKKYTDETTGLIARIENPYSKGKYCLVIAGISAVGTKSAVIAITRHFVSLFMNYSSKKGFFSIINGFDLDGDGKVDSVEILE